MLTMSAAAAALMVAGAAVEWVDTAADMAVMAMNSEVVSALSVLPLAVTAVVGEKASAAI